MEKQHLLAKSHFHFGESKAKKTPRTWSSVRVSNSVWCGGDAFLQWAVGPHQIWFRLGTLKEILCKSDYLIRKHNKLLQYFFSFRPTSQPKHSWQGWTVAWSVIANSVAPVDCQMIWMLFCSPSSIIFLCSQSISPSSTKWVSHLFLLSSGWDRFPPLFFWLNMSKRGQNHQKNRLWQQNRTGIHT